MARSGRPSSVAARCQGSIRCPSAAAWRRAASSRARCSRAGRSGCRAVVASSRASAALAADSAASRAGSPRCGGASGRLLDSSDTEGLLPLRSTVIYLERGLGSNRYFIRTGYSLEAPPQGATVPVEALSIAARQLSELEARPCSAPRAPPNDAPDGEECWLVKGLAWPHGGAPAPARGASAAG